jgi:hypothetical protein
MPHLVRLLPRSGEELQLFRHYMQLPQNTCTVILVLSIGILLERGQQLNNAVAKQRGVLRGATDAQTHAIEGAG